MAIDAAIAEPQQIVLRSDQSTLLKLPEEPATIVVGNPSIADVTIEGKTLYFHPRGFGVTNVIAMDGTGKRLADFLVRIIFEDSYSVSMYGPDGRKTYSCRKDCDPVMRLGDQPGFFDDYRVQARNKNLLAASQALGEELLLPSYNPYYSLPSPAPSY